jgi:signal transduction histidine kinase
MYAHTLRSVLGGDGSAGAAAQLAAKLQELVQTVQRDLRGIVRALHPSPAAELGLAEAIRALADGAPRHADIDVTVSCTVGVR